MVGPVPNKQVEAGAKKLELPRERVMAPHIGQDLSRKHVVLSKGMAEGHLKNGSVWDVGRVKENQ